MQGYKPPEKVVICGAGVIGASVAYYLSLRGTAAVIVDRAGFVFQNCFVYRIHSVCHNVAVLKFCKPLLVLLDCLE
jgi:hypothetical protein